jgi:hypothetical protein
MVRGGRSSEVVVLVDGIPVAEMLKREESASLHAIETTTPAVPKVVIRLEVSPATAALEDEIELTIVFENVSAESVEIPADTALGVDDLRFSVSRHGQIRWIGPDRTDVRTSPLAPGETVRRTVRLKVAHLVADWGPGRIEIGLDGRRWVARSPEPVALEVAERRR